MNGGLFVLFLLINGLWFGGGMPGQGSEVLPPVSQTAQAETAVEAPGIPETLAPEAEPVETEPEQGEVPALTCTFSIECSAIFDHLDDFAALELLPENGYLFAPAEVSFQEGDSAFDVLLRETREAGIHMEYTSTPGYQSAYIEGIGNIYEFDCGPLSGWTYTVNGEMPGVGCSQTFLKNGDALAFHYTCELGGVQ